MKRLKTAMLILSLLALSLATTSACRTTVEVVVKPIVLPPVPQRETIEQPPEEFAEADPAVKAWVAGVLTYYEAYALEWESWGKSIEESNPGGE